VVEITEVLRTFLDAEAETLVAVVNAFLLI
jgi:hypothetical protein